MNKVDKKRLILDKSLELFVRKGYNAATTRDIAMAAGISVGLLFHYFPTKETVLEALIDEATQGMEQMLPIFEGSKNPVEIFRTISAYISGMINQNEGLSLFLLMVQVMTLDCVSQSLREKCDRSTYARASAEVIKEGQEQGYFKEIDALSLAYTFWGAIQGIAEMKYLYGDYTVPDGDVIYSILRK